MSDAFPPAELSPPPAVPSRIHPIVALDVPDRAGAERVVRQLGEACGFYKVGLELFAAEGPSVVHWLRDAGKAVFVDLKLHDIPTTVHGAARSVARLGASLLTVHASGGAAMVAAAVAGAEEGAPGGGCGILGVTILTSLDAGAVASAWGREGVEVVAEVVRLAGVVAQAGGAGVVCSGHEAAAVRGVHGDRLGTLVPGIRLAGGATHDQQRVMTPAAAAAAGARWLVLGRAVTGAADPVAALGAVRAALGAAAA
ncbi:MAG: orotidine 5-phosphate decarboxylase [Gemmatimonadota bacterium]|jgi:orotidine-5'-phosphate decarboxylase